MHAYSQLDSDHAGESYFEDIEIDLVLTEYTPPALARSLVFYDSMVSNTDSLTVMVQL